MSSDGEILLDRSEETATTTIDTTNISDNTDSTIERNDDSLSDDDKCNLFSNTAVLVYLDSIH